GSGCLSARDADKPSLVPVAAALAGLGFGLVATEGTAATLEAAGLEVERVRRLSEEGVGATVVDLVRRGRCDLVINTPQGYGARTDGYLIREAALVNRVPCITTLSGAAAAVHAIASARTEVAVALQERIELEGRSAERRGRARRSPCSDRSGTDSRACRGPCWSAAGSAWRPFLISPSGSASRRRCSASAARGTRRRPRSYPTHRWSSSRLTSRRRCRPA